MIFRGRPTNVSLIRSPSASAGDSVETRRKPHDPFGRASPPRRWSNPQTDPTLPCSTETRHRLPAAPVFPEFSWVSGTPNYRRSWRRSTDSELRLSPRSIATCCSWTSGQDGSLPLCLRLSCPSSLGEHAAALGSALPAHMRCKVYSVLQRPGLGRYRPDYTGTVNKRPSVGRQPPRRSHPKLPDRGNRVASDGSVGPLTGG
jgi:hypothetical protein